jgi:hypothetical protein
MAHCFIQDSGEMEENMAAHSIILSKGTEPIRR